MFIPTYVGIQLRINYLRCKRVIDYQNLSVHTVAHIPHFPLETTAFNSHLRAGETRISIPSLLREMILKFLSRRAAAPTVAAPTVAAAVAEPEPEKRTNAMADAWAAIAGAFQEVASDMHAVIVADEDEVKKKRLEEEKKAEEEKKRLKQRVGIAKVISKVNVKRSRSFAKKKISPSATPKEEAHVEQSIAKVPTKDTATVKRSRSFAKKKISSSETQERGLNEEQPMQSVIPEPTKFSRSLSMKRNSSSAPLAKPMKETSTLKMPQEKETEAEQPTSSNTGMKESPTEEIGNGVKNIGNGVKNQPTSQTLKAKGCCATFTEPTKETNACEKKQEVEKTTKQITKQPTSFTMEVKGSTDNLAKLMRKLDKKEKKLVHLKKELSKAEVEAAETKESIDALTAKYNSFLYGDDDQSGDDGSSIWDDERSQSDDDEQSQCGDDDQRQSDDETSIWDDEDGYDAIDTAFDFTSKSLMLISEKLNQAIYPGQ
eukprot:scaffold1292_cov105-Skeletonema_menzelii.AAC.4